MTMTPMTQRPWSHRAAAWIGGCWKVARWIPSPRRALSAFVVGVMATGAPLAMAVPIVVPPTLNPGDTYRLLYLTTAAGPATSTSLAFYNTFVSNDAASNAVLNALGTTWTAVVSVSTVNDVLLNTGTDPGVSTGVPIYGLSGLKIADNNADLWDNSIDSQIRDANGNVQSVVVYTGSDPFGNGFSGPLGCNCGVDWGRSNLTTGGWIGNNGRGIGQTASLPFYALSAELTVPSVPEPATLTMFGIGLVAALRLTRRRASGPPILQH